MNRLRAAVRLVGAVPITFFFYSVSVGASLLLGAWPRTRARVHGWSFRSWSRSLCRLFGVRVRVEGAAPKAPFVLVSNHVSYLDILALGTELRCVFVAKAEIDGWPLFGAMCRSVRTIFIDRKVKRKLPAVLEQIEATLAAGQGIVIFAEGTSGAGHVVLPFRSSLLELPARLGRPVHWAALGYRVIGDAAPVHLAVTWWADMPLGAHLWSLLQLRGVEARLVLGREPVAHTDRKRLSDALHRAVSSAFEPMVDAAEVDRLLALREQNPSAVPPILRPTSGSS